ncbi:MAG TPA: hypothetical protein P5277_00625 [Candidatus Paceibacterota bacterium]|nr:hypothetical protein [Candidatus Paceibacterota bacterium]
MSCKNCSYSYYSSDDYFEYEKCSISGKYNDYPINLAALHKILSLNQEDSLDFCEYYKPRNKKEMFN